MPSLSFEGPPAWLSFAQQRGWDREILAIHCATCNDTLEEIPRFYTPRRWYDETYWPWSHRHTGAIHRWVFCVGEIAKWVKESGWPEKKNAEK